MVVLKLTHKFGLERKPFSIAVVSCPAAGTSGSFSGKAGAARGDVVAGVPRRTGDQRLQDRLQLLAVLAGEAGAEADVVQLSLIVVKSKQQRSHLFPGLLPAAR